MISSFIYSSSPTAWSVSRFLFLVYYVRVKILISSSISALKSDAMEKLSKEEVLIKTKWYEFEILFTPFKSVERTVSNISKCLQTLLNGLVTFSFSSFNSLLMFDSRCQLTGMSFYFLPHLSSLQPSWRHVFTLQPNKNNHTQTWKTKFADVDSNH